MQIKQEILEKNSIINFYPATAFVTDDLLYVAAKNTAAHSELCRNILALPGVERLLITPELISVRYGQADVEELRVLIMAEIDDYFAEPYRLADGPSAVTEKESAEALADALIRPTLNRDNGDIIIHQINNGAVELSFTGHCAGCPYAANTLQNVIMRTFLRYMPQIREVKLREADK